MLPYLARRRGLAARSLTALLFICGAAGAQTQSASGPQSMQCAPDNGGIELPEGLCALVFADNLGEARHLAVRDNGDVYVHLKESAQGGSVVALRDTNGDGRADRTERFGEGPGTGIAIHKGYLYVAPNTRIVRYRLPESGLVPQGEAEVVVEGFADQRAHAAKPITFDEAGNLYVNIGAPSNACMRDSRTRGSPGMDPCPLLEKSGGIWRFAADETGQQALADGERYATGLRNSVAIDWNASVGALYVVQHGRDQLAQFFPDLYTSEQSAELPAEELVAAQQGDNFGWPYCYYDWHQGKKVLGPEYGGDGSKVGRCADFEDPILAFPGHWAPNDIIFYRGGLLPERYRGGAFVAFHGSWNRAPEPQAGYRVAFVAFADGKPAGAYEDFATGFPGTDRLLAPGAAEYRPSGLAEGPDGSLYIAESVKGRIWRVIPKPQ